MPDLDDLERAVRRLVHKLDGDKAGPMPSDATRGEFWPYRADRVCGWPIELTQVKSLLDRLDTTGEYQPYFDADDA
jgi:hypothetical protein